jgi:chemotaxis protein CheX
MDATYVKPFIESVQSVFETMVHLPVRFEKAYLSEAMPRYDISGIIGMSGEVVGSVVLSFPSSSAALIVAKFVGSELSLDSADFADAVGELVNMISGAAKAKFEGKSVSISCPSVIIGAQHRVAQPSDTKCVCLPCATECGSFAIDIAIRTVNKQAAGATGVRVSAAA